MTGLRDGRWVVLHHRVSSESLTAGQDTAGQDTAGDDGRVRPRGDHFDVMFESTAGLETWAVTRLPDAIAQVAYRLDPHRAAYLDYEGPVSGGRGEVRRVDAGDYRLLESEVPSTLRIETRSEGGGLSTWVLRRIEAAQGSGWWLQRIEANQSRASH